MDPDDQDYCQRRNPADAGTTDATKHMNLEALRKSGLVFTEINSGDIAVFSERGKPVVEFYTRRSRWKVRTQHGQHFGSVAEFVAWLGTFRGGKPMTHSPSNHHAVALAEQRRPGITKLVERIQKSHMTMDPSDVLARAKLLWSSEYIAVTENGVTKTVPNPDYKGGQS